MNRTTTVATYLLIHALAFNPGPILAQENVDVTFRYKPPSGTSGPYYVVGEFNGWQNSQLPLSAGSDGFYERVVRLPVGGWPGGGVPGAVMYKFYYPGIQTWPNDPLNPRVFPDGNQNSILYLKNPTIYHLIPNSRTGIVRTSNPVVTAYLFPAVGSTLDTGSIRLQVDTTVYTGIGQSYDPVRKLFEFQVPRGLASGDHKLFLTAGSTTDSTTFTVLAGFAQITSRSGFTTRKATWALRGLVQDPSVDSATVVRNGTDSTVVALSGGTFVLSVPLEEGANSFVVVARDSTGTTKVSDPFVVTRYVEHRPRANAYAIDAGTTVQLSGGGSTDPDGDPLTFAWEELPGNPATLVFPSGRTGSQVPVTKPAVPGDYLFRLIVTDSTGRADTTRSFFRISAGGVASAAVQQTVPHWVRSGRLYSVFFKAMTPEGTINAALPFLPYLRNLGVNILWVLPVMENASPINNGSGPGYNIKNLFKVAPEYGTNEDFRTFVQQAHALGLRVILDVTPNHTSYAHPFVLDARLYREDSPYWNFYVHTIIPHNTNGLGQSLTPDGFVYYSGFSDQLLNYNWADLDARTFMIDAYDWWVREFDIDGYRMDVYWGPRRRANNGAGGENEMGVPLRLALKKTKADIYLLAEDDGTGLGTEVIYADQGGGSDSGYDWQLYHSAIRSFDFSGGGVDNLHNRLFNGGFVPGPNSSYMRFLENHDEDRIAHVYGSYDKTIPVATSVLLAPGMPTIYQGQEVGYGPGIASYDGRRRGVINWNAAGKSLLQPFYQRLAHARARFPAFHNQTMTRISTGSTLLYAYTRPNAGESAVVVSNFSASAQSITLSISSASLGGWLADGTSYVVTDLLSDSVRTVQASGGSLSMPLDLPAYRSAVLIIADSARRLTLPSLTSVESLAADATLPEQFRLHQNYPNPFNPVTEVRYDLPEPGPATLEVYSVLGQRVAVLADGPHSAGSHRASWHAGSGAAAVASGVYFLRLQAGSHVLLRKMLLLR